MARHIARHRADSPQGEEKKKKKEEKGLRPCRSAGWLCCLRGPVCCLTHWLFLSLSFSTLHAPEPAGIDFSC
jgi:hypothetical protein